MDRAFGILMAFPERGSVSLGELARRAGYPKTTVHDLLEPLIRIGAVERDGDLLRLGLLLFELGMRASGRPDLRAVALPHMQDLMTATGGTVHLAVRDRTDVVYLEKLVGGRPSPAPSVVGGRMPIHLSAVGKAILAFSAAEVVADVVEADLEAATRSTITRREDLLAEIGRVRSQGVAVDRGELRADLVCVGAPIRDGAGVAVAAISVAARTGAVNLALAAAKVRRTAAAVAEALARPVPS
ncbi:IclR family transcriptional regulator [Umezawaea tangerina]|uniref:IclR family transcriptional regulator n=1 Tax=Umezawaea tangerina TaxID=84725 RepID=A0A2T0T6T5_9PSEU|nr:IclR family transcriptional regulator [Umezawaea tangerina]